METQKFKLTHSLPAKITASILLAVLIGLFILSFGGIFILIDQGLYVDPLDEIRDSIFSGDESKLDEEILNSDSYMITSTLIDLGYSLRFWIYPLAFIMLVGFIALFVFLMSSAGRKHGSDEIKSSFITKIPLDLLALAAIILFYYILNLFFEPYMYYNSTFYVLLMVIGTVLLYATTISLLITFATRIKLGAWWKNTLIFIVPCLICRGFKVVGRGCIYLLKNLPLLGKSLFLVAAVALFGLFIIPWDDWPSRFVWLFFGCIIFTAVLVFLAITLDKLKVAGKKLTEGDLSYRVDTSKMFWDFKEHGENLNSMGLGMTRAVDERMKSERMKTELITNVSHDIKTPLTSIINYVDLISKEDIKNEKIREYVTVLTRQSERMKKLIEDLVEASKVTTGNVELNLSPCDVGVLLSQTVGEYEQRLNANELELIVTKPETPTLIMADGRLMWRIFNNLMNNISKYSQPGTRVYLTLEQSGDNIWLAFKNVSKYPLNITADELMERFVRGDSSRHTEGSGLGLSIAKSLAEIQGGNLFLIIDGDFFKVNLKFKCI